MKRSLIGIMLICCCSCDWRRSAGGSGPHARIDVRSSDETIVMQAIQDWMVDHDYYQDQAFWARLSGDEHMRNDLGEIVPHIAYVKRIPNRQGHVAWCITAATENHQYVTIHAHCRFNANDDHELGALADPYLKESSQFDSVIEEIQEYPLENR